MKLIELSESEYKKFEPGHKYGNIMQEPERAELRKAIGWNSYLLGTKDDKKITSACLLLERNRFAMIQMGPVLDWSDMKFVESWLEALIDFCNEKGFIKLEIYPYVMISKRDKHGEVLEEYDQSKLMKIFKDLGFVYGGKTVEAQAKAMRWMSVKDISGMKDMDEVWASYKNTVRTMIRKHSPDVKIEEIKSKDELHDVEQMFSESNLRNKVNDRDSSYYSKIWDIFGDKVVFQVARKRDNNDPVAAHMFFVTNHEAVSYAAGISEKYKAYNGMTLLNDAFFKYCLENGISRCNMYGVNGDFEGNNPLLRFKAQFGITIEEYIGEFSLVLDEKAYAKVQRKEKVLGALRKVKYGGKRLLGKIRK